MAKPISRKETTGMQKRVQDLVAELLVYLEADGFFDEVPQYAEIAPNSLGPGMMVAQGFQQKPTERLPEHRGPSAV